MRNWRIFFSVMFCFSLAYSVRLAAEIPVQPVVPEPSPIEVVDDYRKGDASLFGGETLTLPRHARDVAVSGDGRYAYLIFDSGIGTDNFRVVDINDPENPVVVGGNSVNLSSYARAIAVFGDYAYIALSGPAGNNFRVVDISSPSNPVLITSSLSLPSDAWDIAVSDDGEYVYEVFANMLGTNSLRIINISNPVAPVVVGGAGLNLPPYARGVAVVSSSTIAVVCSNYRKDTFRLVDVGNPASPTIVGGEAVSLPYFPWKVAVDGNFAYVVHFNHIRGENFHVIDVSDRTNPVIIGGESADIYGNFQDIAVTSDTVYLLVDGPSNGLRVVNIDDPATPIHIGGEAVSLPYNPQALALAGDYLCLVFSQLSTSSNVFRTVNVSVFVGQSIPPEKSAASYWNLYK